MTSVDSFLNESAGDSGGASALTAGAEQRDGQGVAAQRATLGGSVTLAYNRTSQVIERDLHARPAKAQLAALIAGEELAHDLLTTGLPAELAAQAEVITHAIEPINRSYARRGMERRGVWFAEAAARSYLYTCQPANLRHLTTNRLRAHLADHRDDYPAHEDADGAMDTNPDARLLEEAMRLYSRPRLVWGRPYPEGVSWPGMAAMTGLMVDRFHDAHRAGVIERDTWARRKVAEDITSVVAYLTATSTGPATVDDVLPRVLGVRVMSHLGPHGAGVHFTAVAHDDHIVVGANHRIGECEHCTTMSNLPNAAPQPTARPVGQHQTQQAPTSRVAVLA